jgi:hypothetical protein
MRAVQEALDRLHRSSISAKEVFYKPGFQLIALFDSPVAIRFSWRFFEDNIFFASAAGGETRLKRFELFPCSAIITV